MIWDSESLRTRTLAAFIYQSSWEAYALLDYLRKSGACSLAGLYKELRLLTDSGALIKVGASWCLSISWTLELSDLCRKLFQSATSSKGIANSIEQAKYKSQIWKFSDLRSMDSFWVHLMFALFEHTKERQLFEIVPRLWFPLADLDLDERYERGMSEKGNKILLLVAGSSMLEKSLVKRWNSPSYQVGLGKHHSFRPSAYLCAIQDWVIEVTVNGRIQREIDEFFSQKKELTNVVYRQFRGILSRRTATHIRLSLNPRLAGICNSNCVRG